MAILVRPLRPGEERLYLEIAAPGYDASERREITLRNGCRMMSVRMHKHLGASAESESRARTT